MAATKTELSQVGPSLSYTITRDSQSVIDASREALRNTAKRARVLVSKQIRKYLALPKSEVDANLKHYYSDQKDEAVVLISRKRFDLSKFKFSQAYKRGTYKSTGAKRKGGFKVKIWKGKPPVHFKRAFLFKEKLAERKGLPRFPVRVLKGPDIASVFLWRDEEIQDDVDTAFVKEFDRAVKRKVRGR